MFIWFSFRFRKQKKTTKLLRASSETITLKTLLQETKHKHLCLIVFYKKQVFSRLYFFGYYFLILSVISVLEPSKLINK